MSRSFIGEWEFLTNSGEYEKAIELVDIALKRNPDNAELLTLKGKTLSMFAVGTVGGGIRTFNTDDPNDTSNHFILLIEDALKCFDKSLKLNPEDDKTYENKALSLARMGAYDDAIECALIGFNINNENITIIYNLSLWYKIIENFSQSLKFSDIIISKKNSLPKQIVSAAYLCKASTQSNQKNPEWHDTLDFAIEYSPDPQMKQNLKKLHQSTKPFDNK